MSHASAALYRKRKQAEEAVTLEWLRAEWAEEKSQGISDPDQTEFKHLALTVIQNAVVAYDEKFLRGVTPAYDALRRHWYAQAGLPEEALWATY